MKTALRLGLALLLGTSMTAAADAVIQRGIDAFTTIDNGKTSYSFVQNPIPGGFFCKGSESFAGTLALKGLALETDPPGGLRGADTVIERLSDAAFDADGLAQTEIRVRALSLVSSKPLQTGCGDFHVYVSLAGEQRATTMRIYRAHENGGTFVAPLAIDARMLFVPVEGKQTSRLELTGSFTFPAQALPWSFAPGPAVRRIEPVSVDTDADRVADTLLLGSSNFAPGWHPEGVRAFSNCGSYDCQVCEPESCHTDPSTQKVHCTGPICACGGSYCP